MGFYWNLSAFIHVFSCFLPWPDKHHTAGISDFWVHPLPRRLNGARCHHSRQKERRRSQRSWREQLRFGSLMIGTNRNGSTLWHPLVHFDSHDFGGCLCKSSRIQKDVEFIWIWGQVATSFCSAIATWIRGRWLGTLTKCFQNWSKVGHVLAIWNLDLSSASQVWYAERITYNVLFIHPIFWVNYKL